MNPRRGILPFGSRLLPEWSCLVANGPLLFVEAECPRHFAFDAPCGKSEQASWRPHYRTIYRAVPGTYDCFVG